MEELEESVAAGPALQLSLFEDTSDWPPFVQSRRRPEKWTRTGKWDSRRSVTVNFVCVCALFGLLLFFARRRWRVMPPLPEEEPFVPKQALSLLMI